MSFSEQTIAGIFLNRAEKYQYDPCIRYKESGSFKSISYNEMKRKILNLGLGLISLGFKKGDIAAIFSENRWEWLVADLAILSVGGIDVPIYSSNSSEEAEYIINDSGAKIIFVSDKEHLDRLMSVKSRIKGIKKIITFEQISAKEKMITSFDAVIEAGLKSKDRKIFEARSSEIEPEDTATIIYTAGTTGPPKGIVLTHDNLVVNMHQGFATHPVLSHRDDALAILPFSHALGRIIGIYLMYHVGAAISIAESFSTVLPNLLEVRPTLVVSVPRLFEKIYSGIFSGMEKAPQVKQKLFKWAFEAADRAVDHIVQKKQIPFGLKIQYDLADRLVFSKLRAGLGLDRLTVSVNGGGPLSVEIIRFFNSIGIPLHNGYGLTETTSVVSSNTFDAFAFGSVGRPVADTDVRIAEDGEIMIKGPQVMKGYNNRPEETGTVFSDGSWLLTGDIGKIDEKGFLYITDRKKDIIITSGGQIISPQNLENSLVTDIFIEQAIVIGESRKHLSALVVPNFIELTSWAKSLGISFDSNDELVSRPDVIKFFEERVAETMKGYAKSEQIKKFRLLPNEFSIDGGELTPSLKLKRKKIIEKYSNLIESMYTPENHKQA